MDGDQQVSAQEAEEHTEDPVSSSEATSTEETCPTTVTSAQVEELNLNEVQKLDEEQKTEDPGGQETTDSVSYVTAVGDQQNFTIQVAGEGDAGQTFILTTDEEGNIIQQSASDAQVIMQAGQTLGTEPQIIHVQANGESSGYDLAQIVAMQGQGADGTTQIVTMQGNESDGTNQIVTFQGQGIDGSTTRFVTMDGHEITMQGQQTDGTTQIVQYQGEEAHRGAQVLTMQGQETPTATQIVTMEGQETDGSSQIVTIQEPGTDGTTQYITMPTSHSGHTQVLTLPVTLPDGTTQTQIITLPTSYSEIQQSSSLVEAMPQYHSTPAITPRIVRLSTVEQTNSETNQISVEAPAPVKLKKSPVTKKIKLERLPQPKKVAPKPAPKPPPEPLPPPKPDLENPIQLSNETIVVVGGKKCFLRCNPDTGDFTAYPVVQELPPGKRKRGRPRKELQPNPPPEEKLSTPGLPEPEGDDSSLSRDKSDADQTNSAAEGLLELSNIGPDGIRRSGRRKKVARVLNDYELGAVLSDDSDDLVIDDGAVEEEEEEEEEELPQTLKRGRGRPRKYSDPTLNPFSALQMKPPSKVVTPQVPGVKRGRGRPRRNPPPVHQPPDYSGPIPALIITNSSGGQTIMLAPGQNLQTLQKLPPLLPKITTDTEAGKTPVVVQSILPTTQEGTTVEQIGQVAEVTEIEAALTEICRHEQEQEQSEEENLEQTAEAAVVLAAEGATKELHDILPTDKMKEETEEHEDAGEMLESEVIETAEITEKDIAELGEENNLPEGVTAAMVQLPEEMIPTFTPGKNQPIKLGLKTNECDLENLKCPRCSFQAYYPQQYQDHLLTAHGSEVEKCKCCNYAVFEREELMKHFKLTHPRNICEVCEFTAEHAYVIKRHMMRHNAKGCECELCGRTYKDQYILKMHIKMVHMPAEVLFECTVCSKKFTRKAHLKRHLRIHDPEKPFKCPHCDYRGCEKSDITKHLLIHEDPKHCCEVCGKSFRHIKNKELHLKRHKGQRDYKCGVCDFYGYTFTDIRKHIERKHSESRIIACDKCGSSFKNELMLREHQKQTCDLLMIEQVIAEAASQGAQQVAMEGISLSEVHQVTIDGPQVISVENIPEGAMVSYQEAQQLAEAALEGQQVVVSEGQILDQSEVEMVTQIAVSQGQIIDGTQMTMADPNALAGTHISAADIVETAVHIVDINDTEDPDGEDPDLEEELQEEEEGVPDEEEVLQLQEVIQASTEAMQSQEMQEQSQIIQISQ